MIKLIGFDLDNTLWPVKPVILYAESELQKHLGGLSPAIPIRVHISRPIDLKF